MTRATAAATVAGMTAATTGVTTAATAAATRTPRGPVRGPAGKVKVYGKRLNTNENGKSAKFRVKLNRQPTDNVVIRIRISDLTEGALVTEKLVFTPENWNQFQTVQVFGMDDAEIDGDQRFRVRTSRARSDDAAFDRVKVKEHAGRQQRQRLRGPRPQHERPVPPGSSAKPAGRPAAKNAVQSSRIERRGEPRGAARLNGAPPRPPSRRRPAAPRHWTPAPAARTTRCSTATTAACSAASEPTTGHTIPRRMSRRPPPPGVGGRFRARGRSPDASGRTADMLPFHVAVPVRDLAAARAFYGGTAGTCPRAGSTPAIRAGGSTTTCSATSSWSTKPATAARATTAGANRPAGRNPVDGDAVPVPHCGAILEPDRVAGAGGPADGGGGRRSSIAPAGPVRRHAGGAADDVPAGPVRQRLGVQGVRGRRRPIIRPVTRSPTTRPRPGDENPAC